MKQFIILMIAGLLAGAFIYYMDKAALDPMEGVTVNGQTVDVVPSNTPSESKFEPLDLSSNSSFMVKTATAAIPVKVQSKLSVRTMGNADAPVKMYVFSSLTCSHCSYFHGVVLKDIEKKYIDTGKVFLTYIDFPFDKRALAGAMLVRCVKPESYFPFLETLFKNQKEWAFKQNSEEVIMAYASLQGLSKGDVKACLADTTLQESIINTRDSYMKKYDIDATPTTLIVKDGKSQKIVGADANKLEIALKKMMEK